MAMPASDYFDLHQVGPVTVAKVAVEVIRHPEQAQEFGRDLLALVDRDGVRALIVNLSATHYLGSTAFGSLFLLAKHMEAAGGKLALCALHPDLVLIRLEHPRPRLGSCRSSTPRRKRRRRSEPRPAHRGLVTLLLPGGATPDGGWRMADGGWRMADGGWQKAEARKADRSALPSSVFCHLPSVFWAPWFP